jgi:hypothetical protein
MYAMALLENPEIYRVRGVASSTNRLVPAPLGVRGSFFRHKLTAPIVIEE